jgi:RNA polymerase sigma-70 factor (ECF subfamily)
MPVAVEHGDQTGRQNRVAASALSSGVRLVMTVNSTWDLERYRPLLALQARQVELDPRLRRRFDRSDVVQEALLKAHASRDQFRGQTEAELVRWLSDILASALVDEVRRAYAQKRDISQEEAVRATVSGSSAQWEAYVADPDLTPSAQAERHELFVRIAQAMEQLPDDQRDVVLLRDVQGCSVAEIAAQLGRTEKSVAGLLLRGRGKLRQLLQDVQ